MKTKYEWKYGENESQKYYDTYIGKDYLCVFANNWQPDIYMGYIDYDYKAKNNSRSVTIMDKTKNDAQRRKEHLPLDCDISELHTQAVLCSNDPEFMMKKVEYCYEHKINEVSNKPYKEKNKDDVER